MTIYPYQCIRTYYARLFEAKFLSGLVAGALCKNGKIGYMADYPICGMIANINTIISRHDTRFTSFALKSSRISCLLRTVVHSS